MAFRSLMPAGLAILSGGIALAEPVAAHLAVPPAGSGYFTPGRSWSIVATAFGLTGMVLGVRALAGSAARVRAGHSRRTARVALATGLVGAIIGGIVVAAEDGGPGTGYGIVGGFLAVVIGLIAGLLGGLALTRSARLDLTGASAPGSS